MADKPHMIVGSVPHFTRDGVLAYPGEVVIENTTAKKPGADPENDPFNNLVPVGKSDTSGVMDYEIAAVAPSGPNPENPQAIPGGTGQRGNKFMAPAGADSAAESVQIVAETADDKSVKAKS